MAEVDAEVDVAPDGTRPPDPARLPRGVPFFAVIAVAVLVLLVGGAGGAYQGKLSEVQKNDNSSFLPASAESTRAAGEAAAFNPAQLIPGFVVFHRDSGLTEQDKQAAADLLSQSSSLPGVDASAVTTPTFSTAGTAAAIYVPLIANQNGTAVAGTDLADHENAVVSTAQAGVPPGPQVYPASSLRQSNCPGPGCTANPSSVKEITRLRDTTGRPGILPTGERATADSLRQQLRTYRDEITWLRTENQELRDQLARHLGAARTAAATAGTPAVVTWPRTGCPIERSRRGVTAGRNVTPAA